MMFYHQACVLTQIELLYKYKKKVNYAKKKRQNRSIITRLYTSLLLSNIA